MFVGSEKQQIAEAESQPEQFFRCSKNWPQCKFNFVKPYELIDEFVFKIENLEQVLIIDEYFTDFK